MEKSKARQIKPMMEWNHIPWHKLDRKVFKLQKRIFKASSRGDVKAVRRLQKTLIKSWSARCLAVRKVTQENQGKKTAGVDGKKSLSPSQRLKLTSNLKISHKAQPTRRVWIPKPGKKEKRPLGIPTIHDRALQMLVKLALEPEWEAKFEPNSYGFRPGRSCHDAIGAIFSAIHKKPKFVLDADIAKCFDRINHQALIDKINTYPSLRRQIKAWLKSGVMDNKLFVKTTGKNQFGEKLGFKTIIKPSKDSIQRHYDRVKEIIKSYKSSNQIGLICKLNPIIRGWSNYYSTVVSKVIFHRLDHLITMTLLAWGISRHPNKSKSWVVRKYWKTRGNSSWSFATQQEGLHSYLYLAQYKETPIIRHIKVKGNCSPYDGNPVYWSTRMGRHPEMPTRTAILLKSQKGKCKFCGLMFRDGDKLNTDHIIPTSKGGRDIYDNLQLLHKHCHDKKSALDRGMYDKHQFIEERYERKLSRTVLQTSREGDFSA